MLRVIETIRGLRRKNAQALAHALSDTASAHPSEIELRDAYHERLAAIPGISSEGWYLPPPHGIILSIGNPPEFQRVCRGSFRPEDAWPGAESRLDKDSLLYVYSSPVDQKTGLIGDMGCSLYRGGDAALRAHLRSAWNITLEIVDYIKPQMTFAQIFEYSQRAIESAGMTNIVDSVHGGSITDIGHTVPWSDEEPDESETKTLAFGSPQEVAALVSGKRRFVNASNHEIVSDNVAFTIEPRVTARGLPMASFHIVVAFDAGEKQVISELDPVLESFGMTGFDV